MESLEGLLDLQALDSEIDRLLERRQSLPVLGEFRETHDELTRVMAEIEATSERKRELDLAEDKAEGEMRLDEEKLEREERRLYAGGLSARDATHLRDEVEMLRTRISKREDEALALLEGQQAEEKALEALENTRTSLEKTKGQLEGTIEQEWKVIDAEVSRLREDRAGVASGIDPDVLELYEEIRPTKEGVGAAPLADFVCGGCHLKLSAAEDSQVRRQQPPRCIHCRRILVPR